MTCDEIATDADTKVVPSFQVLKSMLFQQRQLSGGKKQRNARDLGGVRCRRGVHS
jgi:hypothetical protein